MIAALAQLWVRRSQTRERWLGELLKHCAAIYALESAFRGLAYDAVYGSGESKARGWSAEQRRNAEAHVFLLAADPTLVSSVETLREAGREMHRAIGTDAFEERALAHQNELERFATAARQALRRGRVV